jgi:hypothetical protein
MSQITQGIQLSYGLGIYYGVGDPNVEAAPSAPPFVKQINNAAVGSLYLRTDGPDSTHCLYVCTGTQQMAASGDTIAQWTAK